MLDIEELRRQLLKTMNEDELEEKIQTKIKSLAGLISKEGAVSIIANESGIKPESFKNSLKLLILFPDEKCFPAL